MTRGRPSRVTIYKRLDSATRELQDHFRGLPDRQDAESVWHEIRHLDAHHSTALEGNTLTLRQVEKLLEEGSAVGAKPLRDYLEVQGYADAANWVYGQAIEGASPINRPLISIQEVRHIHYMLMDPVWAVAPHPEATGNEKPGSFREHNLRPFGGGMQPPPWPQVSTELDHWVEKAHRLLKTDTHKDTPIAERLAEVHCGFERVHPFIDGNGQTGRLVLNMMLIRLELPPVIILRKQRSQYLSALRKADLVDYGPLGELLARSMTDNINRFILPSIAGPARLVPLAALVDNDLSLVALRQAAHRGRLEAQQGSDGVWLSTRNAVNEYKDSRRRRKGIQR